MITCLIGRSQFRNILLLFIIQNITVFPALFFLIRKNIITTGIDGYFHIRYSSNSFFWVNFKWLPYTIHSESLFDQHFLFHRILYVFIKLFGINYGAILYHYVILSIFVYVLYLSIIKIINKNVEFNFSILFLIYFILYGNNYFLYRILMLRTTTLSIIFFLLSLNFIYYKKYKSLFLISLLYALVYIGCVLIIIPLISIIFTYRKVDVRIILTIVVAMVIGILIHPDFPLNVYHIYFTLFKKTFLIHERVGNEWLPLSFDQYICCNVSIILFLLYSFLFIIKNRNFNYFQIYILINLIFLFILSIVSSRFIDYLHPIAWLFVITSLKDQFNKLLNKKYNYVFVISFVFFSLILFTVMSMNAIKDKELFYIEDSSNVSAWLERKCNESETIINIPYHTFPLIFFHTQRIYFLQGLDPEYLYAKNPDISNIINEISDNNFENFDRLNDLLEVRYILVDNEMDELIKKLFRFNYSDCVYLDDYFTVFEITIKK